MLKKTKNKKTHAKESQSIQKDLERNFVVKYVTIYMKYASSKRAGAMSGLFTTVAMVTFHPPAHSQHSINTYWLNE